MELSTITVVSFTIISDPALILVNSILGFPNTCAQFGRTAVQLRENEVSPAVGVPCSVIVTIGGITGEGGGNGG